MALTLAQLQDYINTNVKKNGRNAIGGDVMNYALEETLGYVANEFQTILVAGASLKTVNGNSLLGAGDVVVQGVLISGVNIKTVGGVSLLGSGDVAVSSGIIVGTTSVTSGVAGRVFFEGVGNIVQEDSGFLFDYTNKTFTNYGKGGQPTNVSFGVLALTSNSSGTQNTAIGVYSLQLVVSGIQNTGIGNNSLNANVGSYNTAVGADSLKLLTTGIVNIGIGVGAGNSIITGSANTIIGSNIAGISSSLSQNVVISDGYGNIAIRKDLANLIGFGYSMSDVLGANVDIKHSGSGVGDIGLRLRNSAKTHNLFEQSGNGQFYFRGTDAQSYIYWNGAAQMYVKAGASGGTFSIDNQVGELVLRASTNLRLAGNGTGIYLWENGNIFIGGSGGIIQGNGTKNIIIPNSTAPSLDIADGTYIYSADQVANNACFHTRSEDGSIVKIYSISGWGTPTGTLTRTTFDESTVTLPELAQRVAAMITDLKTGHQLFKA